MKLPNCELATVPEEKITRYLLNPAHPAGGSKAVFFLRFGFKIEEWRLLAEALLRHARESKKSSGQAPRHSQYDFKIQNRKAEASFGVSHPKGMKRSRARKRATEFVMRSMARCLHPAARS